MGKNPKHHTRLSKSLSLLNWLAAMCSKDVSLAISGEEPITQKELLDDRTIPWLPVERGNKPTPELDGLVETGHAERSDYPVPMRLRIHSGILNCQEAYRLTRKGREATAEYQRLSSARDLVPALEVLIRMFAFPEEDADALRAYFKART